MKRWIVRTSAAVAALAAGTAAVVTWPQWSPHTPVWLRNGLARFAGTAPGTAGGPDHAPGDQHVGHASHAGEIVAVELSSAARENLGLKLGLVKLSNYTSTIVIPGRVVAHPGHSEHRLTTAHPGVITRLKAFPGQAVKPGDPLLELRLTSAILSNAQADLLKTLQDLELLDAELKRIAPLVENGSIPAKTKIEKEYEKRRLEALRLVQIQDLLVRGLTPEQIAEIVAHRQLIREITVRAPGRRPPFDPIAHGHDHPPVVPPEMLLTSPEEEPGESNKVFTIERIDSFPGKVVQPGDELCDLAYLGELSVEGHAVEREAGLLADVLAQQRGITVEFEGESPESAGPRELRIRYVENTIDPSTRTLRFYLPLQNEVVRDTTGDNGVIYRTWRYRPGQKVRLLVPMATLADQIVLPPDAVVTEGSQAFVYVSRGRRLEQREVIVLHRDPRAVVVQRDGRLPIGERIAMNQAYQVHLAAKNQQSPGGGHDHDHDH